MINLVDRVNLENSLKYFQYVERSTNFNQGGITPYPYFDSIDVDFSDNLNSWMERKAHIYKLFGNKLKIVKELGETNVCNDNMVRNLRHDFLEEHGERFNLLIKIFLQELNGSEINQNKLEEDVQVLNVTMKKGWKITRCFAALELNKKRLAEQQDLYSTFLQSLYVKGRLVLSIDPLDYLTMSVSRSGWSSCHHPTGGYGTGAISYMNDSSTIIAYVETEDPMTTTIYDTETGNDSVITMPNKIWRQIVTINPEHDYALQLREYPNTAPVYSSAVAEAMVSILSSEQGHKYESTKMSLSENAEWLQENNRDLYRYIFYSDLRNGNFEYLGVILKESFGGVSELIESVTGKIINNIEVGEVVYCACGCGDTNWYSQLFVEESNGDDDYDDEENWDGDEDW
jgi:hypothetical protein